MIKNYNHMRTYNERSASEGSHLRRNNHYNNRNDGQKASRSLEEFYKVLENSNPDLNRFFSVDELERKLDGRFNGQWGDLIKKLTYTNVRKYYDVLVKLLETSEGVSESTQKDKIVLRLQLLLAGIKYDEARSGREFFSVIFKYWISYINKAENFKEVVNRLKRFKQHLQILVALLKRHLSK